MNHGVIWSRAAHALMTTVWRPRVRVRVPDVDEGEKGVEVAEEVNDAGLSKKGTKRKRAPPKGPCEHGVKYRSQCKECGGSGICEHSRRRDRCKECRAV